MVLDLNEARQGTLPAPRRLARVRLAPQLRRLERSELLMQTQLEQLPEWNVRLLDLRRSASEMTTTEKEAKLVWQRAKPVQ